MRQINCAMKPSILFSNNVYDFLVIPCCPLAAPKNGESLKDVVSKSVWRMISTKFDNRIVHEGTFAECVWKATVATVNSTEFNGWGYDYKATNYKGYVDLEGEVQELIAELAYK